MVEKNNRRAWAPGEGVSDMNTVVDPPHLQVPHVPTYSTNYRLAMFK